MKAPPLSRYIHAHTMKSSVVATHAALAAKSVNTSVAWTFKMLLLDKKAVEDLTRRVRPSAQLRCLHRMGIPAITRADGTVAVLSSAVDAILGPTQERRRRTAAPNWDALDAKETKP